MKQTILLILLLILCGACTRHSQYWDTISAINSYIEERPDSALWVLENIDSKQLSNKEEKAQYALLYSMALDKNFIDKTDFSILQPAIDYYQHKGSATDKLRTNYYQGRIYQNQGSHALAMKCFVNALHKGEASDDLLTKARTNFAQSNIYYAMNEFDNFIEANKNAAALYKEAGRLNNYQNAQIRLFSGYFLKRDSANTVLQLEKCKKFLHSLNLNQLHDFYSVYLTYLIAYGSKQEIRDVINETLENLPHENINWLTMANAYNNLNEYETALYALDQYDTKKFDADSKMKYQILLSQAYEHLGMYEESLKAYKAFSFTKDSTAYAFSRQGTKFVTERHQLELQALNEKASKHHILLISAFSILSLLFILIWIRSRLKINQMERTLIEQEMEKYKAQYFQMEEERDHLSAIVAQNLTLTPEVKIAISKRLDILNTFFTAYITNNIDIDRKASKEIENVLANKDAFIISTKLAYAGSHPQFVKYLEEKGLTDWEIGYCCLYIIGLKGKEIGSFIKMQSHYNISSEIRVKLGINEHDTNLGLYIKKLLKDFE
ncbi:MAG: hypothetical protein J6Q25_03050 [Bacteroidales bacterium]|nr:hypothetical protein [Bacteroidales bacterium]